MAQPKLVIKNDKGEPVVLNEYETYKSTWMANKLKNEFGANPMTPYLNSMGYEVAVTTLTTISKKITEQKFYQIPFADYVPVRAGEGTWSSNLTTYRSFQMGGEFEDGVIDTGGQNARLATADAGVDALNIKIFNWAKAMGYSIFDLELAAKSGNWDLVSAKEKARKMNWDLGLQRVAFLGARGQNGAGGACLGLMNQGGVVSNTQVLQGAISGLSPQDLSQFCAQVVEAYRANVQRTAWPTAFIVPESDYNGLASQASPQFPVKSKLELLEDMFKVICRNASFKILPNAYGDKAQSGLSVQRYVLLNQDDESIRMDLPLDYTTSLANSLDNFSFQNVGYGQFTGVLAYRPLEILYLDY